MTRPPPVAPPPPRPPARPRPGPPPVRRRRLPAARMPKGGERKRGWTVVSVVVHALVIGLLLNHVAEAGHEGNPTEIQPGAGGGGGGGAGREGRRTARFHQAGAPAAPGSNHDPANRPAA